MAQEALNEPAQFTPRWPFVHLASQSPRRRELLAQIGVTVQLLLPSPEEDSEALEAEVPGEAPEAYVQRVTLAKLQAAIHRQQARGLAPAPVLCADTTVAFEGRIFGKPHDVMDARRTLQCLSGRTHQVHTALALAVPLAQPGPNDELMRITQRLHTSVLEFAPLTPRQIEAYIATQEPFGKAGAYGIQGAAAAFVRRLVGSHSGVMGLPLFEAAELLRDAGVLP